MCSARGKNGYGGKQSWTYLVPQRNLPGRTEEKGEKSHNGYSWGSRYELAITQVQSSGPACSNATFSFRRLICNGVCACVRACLHCVIKQEDVLQWCNEALRDLSRHRMLCDEMKEVEVKWKCGMYRGEGKCIRGFGVET